MTLPLPIFIAVPYCATQAMMQLPLPCMSCHASLLLFQDVVFSGSGLFLLFAVVCCCCHITQGQLFLMLQFSCCFLAIICHSLLFAFEKNNFSSLVACLLPLLQH